MKNSTLQYRPLCRALIAAGLSSLIHIGSLQADDSLPVIVVNADFQDTGIEEFSSSASIFSAEQLKNRVALQLEDVLNLAPNVNFASGASRGRYIQIRGTGERAAFIEPVNYSVGVIVDGIDLTGISGAATLFDTRQVEVLRGPQGTLYGANALAGLINVVSNEPSLEQEAGLEATIGNYNSRVLNGYASGPVNAHSAYRIAFQRTRSDGFMNNSYLNRDDTNNIDEDSLRARFNWQPLDQISFDLVLLHADIDNGYDAFSLDNTRDTLSDEPGHDGQLTDAIALNSAITLDSGYLLKLLLSQADSAIEYGYDEDWSNADICSGTPCDGWEYSSYDNYLRDNKNLTLDVRLSNNASDSDAEWTAGLYLRNQQLDLLREYTYAASDFESEYNTRNQALYAQLKTPLNDSTRLITGLRFEQREADYSNNDSQTLSDTEQMWGGKIALEHDSGNSSMMYGLLSRGYKAGGFNTNSSIPDNLREYDGESMLNYELGVKGRWLEDRLKAQLAVFYQSRDNIQIDQSFVQPVSGTDCPCSFEDYIDNAASGTNYGIETQFDWTASVDVKVFGSLGLLHTRFDDFISYSHVDADESTGSGVDMDGRELAHAPNWQYTLGVEYLLSDHWTLRVDSEGKDEFYFGDGHDEKSKAYQLYNARLSWQQTDWSVALWVRNLTDKEYQTRGFGNFGNDPRNFYATEPYYQLGSPRTFGLTVAYQF